MSRQQSPRWWTLFVKGYEARAVFNASFSVQEAMTLEGWAEVAELSTKLAAYDYAVEFFDAVPLRRLCVSCVSAGVSDPPPGDLVTGRLFREHLMRVSIFRGYLCNQCVHQLEPGWFLVGSPRDRGGELRADLPGMVAAQLRTHVPQHSQH